MTIDWKTVLSTVLAALIGAGGTLGVQKATAPSAITPAIAQQLTLVEGMTGLCIRVEKPTGAPTK